MLYLREVRKRCGVYQTELARRLGVAQATVSKWEAGINQPNADDLLKIAEILKVPIQTLFGNDMETVSEERGRCLEPEEKTDGSVAHGAPQFDDTTSAFATSLLKDGMNYDDLNPQGKAALYEYFQFLVQRYPKDK